MKPSKGSPATVLVLVLVVVVLVVVVASVVVVSVVVVDASAVVSLVGSVVGADVVLDAVGSSEPQEPSTIAREARARTAGWIRERRRCVVTS